MGSMLSRLFAVLKTVRSLLKSRRQLTLENLALRQQLAMLKPSAKRPRVSPADRLFWILFSKYVEGWRAMLHALHPETVVRWHREGFRLYWTWKSRRQRVWRPSVDKEIRKLIRQMQSANVGWGGASNPWGNAQAWYRYLPSDSFKVYGSSAKTTFADLADVSRKSCRLYSWD